MDKIELVRDLLFDSIQLDDDSIYEKLAQQIDALYTEKAGIKHKENCAIFYFGLDGQYSCNCGVSQPIPPVEPDLMLTDEEILKSLPEYISLREHFLEELKRVAKAQLKACQDYYQPLLDAKDREIAGLKKELGK